MADRVTQVVSQTALVPTPAVRASQAIAQTALVPTPAVRASQVVMQVAVSGATGGGGGTAARSWGTVIG